MINRTFTITLTRDELATLEVHCRALNEFERALQPLWPDAPLCGFTVEQLLDVLVRDAIADIRTKQVTMKAKAKGI